jgi:hypothetical protein
MIAMISGATNSACSTGILPVRPAGILPVAFGSTGKMPIVPTAKMAVLRKLS